MNVTRFVLRIRSYRCHTGWRYTAIFDHVLGAYHGDNAIEVERRAILILHNAFAHMSPAVHVVLEAGP